MSYKLIILSCFISMALPSFGDEECVHDWRYFDGNSDPLYYGIDAGTFKPGIQAYVGRGIYDGQYVPGRIQITEPTGLYHPSGWQINKVTDSVDYLRRNDSQVYEWTDSSEGKRVHNAVIPGHTPGRTVWYIARVKVGSNSYLGKVHGEWYEGSNGNAHYEDGNNQEVETKHYQVLTCRILRRNCFGRICY